MNIPDETINCWIVKSNIKSEMYLYLANKEGFDEVPEELQTAFGEPEFVMELDLFPDRKLARVEVKDVIQAIKAQGFYLQMPPEMDADLYFGD